MESKDRRALGLLLLLALAVRAWLACTTPLVATDGALFLWNAERWETRGWRAAVDFQKQPLYPFLIWTLHGVCGGYEGAARLISVVFGALTVLPVFLLGRRLAGREAGLVAGLLFAILPYHARLSSDVMSEGTYFHFLFWALWLGYVAGADGRAWAALLAGLAAGIAYLTREEGGLVAGIAGVWILAASARTWRQSLGGALLRGALLTAAFTAVLLPYVIGLHAETGRWMLWKKGQSYAMESYTVPGSDAFALPAESDSKFAQWTRKYGRAAACAIDLSRKVPTLFKLYLLPLVLAPFVRRRVVTDARMNGYLAGSCMAWMLLFAGVQWKLGYLSSRHLTTLLIATIPWMGMAAAGVRSWFGEGPRGWYLTLALLFVGGTLFFATLKPQREEQMGLRLAGEWIAWQGISRDGVIVAADEKVALYAHAQLRYWPKCPYAVLRERVLPQARYFAATAHDARAQTEDFPLEGVPGELVRRWTSPAFGDKKDDAGRVIVWEVVR